MFMESLNLNTLATSLPTPYQNAETELVNNFKVVAHAPPTALAAALSITTLYRSSRDASKRAYNGGYAAACNDLLMMIQQGVSVGGDSSGPTGSAAHESDGMTIGKVMDWIEARMEAIKSREEEEEEEEEKEKDRERGRSAGTTSASTTTAVAKQADTKVTKPSKTREQAANVTVPRQRGNNNNASQVGSSPSPPPPATSKQAQRTSKSRSAKGDTQISTAASDHLSPPPQQQQQPQPFTLETMNSPPMTMSIAPLSDVTAGTKRRHAVMMMLDSPSSVSSSGSSAPSPIATPGAVMTRRRTRSSRGGGGGSYVQNQNVNLGFPSEAMDVEEDGRERKRVARR